MYDNLDIMAVGLIDNLIPQSMRTKEEQRIVATLGGHASGVARRRNREITELYGRWLAKQHNLNVINDEGKVETKRISTKDFFDYVMDTIIAKCNKESVMMISEIRKAREGTTYHIDNGAVDADLQETSAEVLKAEFEAELAKRDAIMAKRAEVLPEDAAPGQVVAYEVEKPEESRAVELQQAAHPEPTIAEELKACDAGQPEGEPIG